MNKFEYEYLTKSIARYDREGIHPNRYYGASAEKIKLNKKNAEKYLNKIFQRSNNKIILFVKKIFCKKKHDYLDEICPTIVRE